MKTILLSLVLLLSFPALADDARLLDAIQRVESGGEKDPAHAVGDRGLARGWLQIHRSYWADAKKADPGLPAYEKTCASKSLSRRCAAAYWKRWGARTDREKALLHHYGATRWRKNPNADPDGYLTKVRAATAKVR